MKNRWKYLGYCSVLSMWGLCAEAQLLYPSNLVYKGAFRLPDASGISSWLWSGAALTYYPLGDPAGPGDGYPGSLFGVGHDWDDAVSEITIPPPVISASKNLDDLNTAQTLQPFADIRNGQEFEGAGIYRVALEYLPAQGAQAAAKLYMAWGRHIQFDRVPSHGWCNLDLSDPQPQGWWYIQGEECHYVNDYLFAIPTNWAASFTPGKLLVTGRYRDGGLSGMGPAMYAIGPWNDGNPPAPNSELSRVTLLEYDFPFEGARMNGWAESDEWPGAAWLTKGAASAVVFVGVKGYGETWYGYQDGTRYDDCLAAGNCPPDGRRGWWSDEMRAQISFFNPDDLAAVASGTMAPNAPQPYAAMNIEEYLYREHAINDMERLAATAYDRERGLLYVFERLADEDKCLAHVFAIENAPHGPVPEPAGYMTRQTGDYDGDDRADPAVFWGATGNWYVNLSDGGALIQNWGWSGAYCVPGDYDGDGQTDLAVFFPEAGIWYIHPVAGGYIEYHLGAFSSWPVAADYDGDGTTDVATYDLLTGDWSIRQSATQTTQQQNWGWASVVPVPADYDGDGRTDLAVFAPQTGNWHVNFSGGGQTTVNWGWASAWAVPGDYDGDGTDDVAVYWPDGGNWYLRYSGGGADVINWGWSASEPVPGDYDGDAQTDMAVYYPVNGNWYIRNSADSSYTIKNWGWTEAIPAAAVK
ncbi:MAG: VCBS repeat-containing protein [Spartobacteria bacterium]|nr:VCBS repeat-containing protein [Spartobacteria bacterium]